MFPCTLFLFVARKPDREVTFTVFHLKYNACGKTSCSHGEKRDFSVTEGGKCQIFPLTNITIHIYNDMN